MSAEDQVPQRIRRAWFGALAAFFLLAGAGAVAILLDRAVLGLALLLAAGIASAAWADWLRKRGFHPHGSADHHNEGR